MLWAGDVPWDHQLEWQHLNVKDIYFIRNLLYHRKEFTHRYQLGERFLLALTPMVRREIRFVGKDEAMSLLKLHRYGVGSELWRYLFYW